MFRQVRIRVKNLKNQNLYNQDRTRDGHDDTSHRGSRINPVNTSDTTKTLLRRVCFFFKLVLYHCCAINMTVQKSTGLIFISVLLRE